MAQEYAPARSCRLNPEEEDSKPRTMPKKAAAPLQMRTHCGFPRSRTRTNRRVAKMPPRLAVVTSVSSSTLDIKMHWADMNTGTTERRVIASMQDNPTAMMS